MYILPFCGRIYSWLYKKYIFKKDEKMSVKYLKIRFWNNNHWSAWQTFKTSEFDESLLGDLEYEITYLGSWKIKEK